MEIAKIITEGLMYFIPALLVLIGMKWVVENQNAREKAIQQYALRTEVIKSHFHLRLAAYERAILFLERISPQQLFTLLSPTGMSAAQYFEALNTSIRAEYEHNITQQIYLSPQAWFELVKAKDETLAIAREVLSTLPPTASALELANGMVEKMQENESIPANAAILAIKTETNNLFTY